MRTETDHQAEADSEARLYAFFTAHGIGWAHHVHPPLHTVADAQALRGRLPGAHIKNMFLREKRGALWLVSCLEDRQIRIRDLEREIGAKAASFAKPEVLWEALGVRPGAVTPFALINDPDRAVRFVVDRAVLSAEIVNAHPLHNRATAALAQACFRRFLSATGHAPLAVDFDALEAQARARASA